MTRPILHIGDKRLSSWSMRPWLALKEAGLDFEERLIPLDQRESRTAIEAVSPGGTVPALHAGELVIWDSLAICEWAAEQTPSLWPEDAGLRARARSAAAWMHDGAPALRRECPMDLQRTPAQGALSDAARNDIAALDTLWGRLKAGEGDFLFGAWSIADAMFTPVATRVRDYRLEMSASALAYCEALLSMPSFIAWQDAARRETYQSA
jgi:glutathione S-transferase